MCCLPTLFQVGIALFLYKWVRECRFACKVDALANFPIAFFISAMSSFTLLILDLISLLLKPDRSKSSVRFSFSAEPLWGGFRAWQNTSPEAFPADRVLLSIFRSRRSLPYNISNFSNCSSMIKVMSFESGLVILWRINFRYSTTSSNTSAFF